MQTLTDNQIRSIFVAIKQGKRAEAIYPGASSKQYYFFYKAHKLVDVDSFMSYWKPQTDKQVLIDILKDHYPPLDYNHAEADGYPDLSKYVAIAKTIF